MGGTRVAYPLPEIAGGHKKMSSIVDIHASQSQLQIKIIKESQNKTSKNGPKGHLE
jgi:hypothetical protein